MFCNTNAHSRYSLRPNFCNSTIPSVLMCVDDLRWRLILSDLCLLQMPSKKPAAKSSAAKKAASPKKTATKKAAPKKAAEKAPAKKVEAPAPAPEPAPAKEASPKKKAAPKKAAAKKVSFQIKCPSLIFIYMKDDSFLNSRRQRSQPLRRPRSDRLIYLGFHWCSLTPQAGAGIALWLFNSASGITNHLIEVIKSFLSVLCDSEMEALPVAFCLSLPSKRPVLSTS